MYDFNFVTYQANIKIIFVSPYPTISKRERSVGQWIFFFFFSEKEKNSKICERYQNQPNFFKML